MPHPKRVTLIGAFPWFLNNPTLFYLRPFFLVCKFHSLKHTCLNYLLIWIGHLYLSAKLFDVVPRMDKERYTFERTWNACSYHDNHSRLNNRHNLGDRWDLCDHSMSTREALSLEQRTIFWCTSFEIYEEIDCGLDLEFWIYEGHRPPMECFVS